MILSTIQKSIYLNSNIHLFLCTCNDFSPNNKNMLQARDNSICNKNNVAHRWVSLPMT